MQTIGSRLSDQLIGSVQVLHGPLVLLRQLLQALSFGQRPLQPLDTTQGVVLGLVEHLLRLEHLDQLVLTLQSLLGVQQLGELLDVDIGLSALLGEQLGTLRASRLERLDPIWWWRWHCMCVVVEKGGMCRIRRMGEEEKGEKTNVGMAIITYFDPMNFSTSPGPQ